MSVIAVASGADVPLAVALIVAGLAAVPARMWWAARGTRR